MGAILVLAVWGAGVIAVDAVFTRPWKSAAARSIYALIPAAVMTAWVLGTGFVSYRDLMAQGSWTAASVALGFIPLKAILLSLMAYAAGRAAMAARASRDRPKWLLAGVLAGLCLWSVVDDVRASRAAGLEKHAADETLPPADVAALAAKVRAGDAARAEAGAFLGNPLCPPDLIAEYARAPESYWRVAVARNARLDAGIADRLIDDADETVRYYLAFNHSLTPAQLTRLAGDKSSMVREIVVRMSALPDEVFARLVADPSAEVRAVAALQARITEDDLARLRNDPDERVRRAAGR